MIEGFKRKFGELLRRRAEEPKIMPPHDEIEGNIVYRLESGELIITGVTDYPWHGEGKDALLVNGFSFGIFGNIVLCDREKFGEVSERITRIKEEFDRGNRHPWFGFVIETFYNKKPE